MEKLSFFDLINKLTLVMFGNVNTEWVEIFSDLNIVYGTEYSIWIIAFNWLEFRPIHIKRKRRIYLMFVVFFQKIFRFHWRSMGPKGVFTLPDTKTVKNGLYSCTELCGSVQLHRDRRQHRFPLGSVLIYWSLCLSRFRAVSTRH